MRLPLTFRWNKHNGKLSSLEHGFPIENTRQYNTSNSLKSWPQKTIRNIEI